MVVGPLAGGRRRAFSRADHDADRGPVAVPRIRDHPCAERELVGVARLARTVADRVEQLPRRPRGRGRRDRDRRRRGGGAGRPTGLGELRPRGGERQGAGYRGREVDLEVRRVVVLGLAGHRETGRPGDLDGGVGDRREAPAVDADGRAPRDAWPVAACVGEVSGSSVNSKRSRWAPERRPQARRCGSLARRRHRHQRERCHGDRPGEPSGGHGAMLLAARARAERPLPSVVQARQPRRERQPVEESPDTTGQGGRETDPGKPAGKCHRNTPPMAEPLQSSAQARLKWCGKSAPASRRRGGWANPTRCKAKQDRSQAARRGPGRPQRWMAVHDRIRLTGLLRKSPAYAGFFYGSRSRELVTALRQDLRRSLWNRSARAPGSRGRRRDAPRRDARHSRAFCRRAGPRGHPVARSRPALRLLAAKHPAWEVAVASGLCDAGRLARSQFRPCADRMSGGARGGSRAP